MRYRLLGPSGLRVPELARGPHGCAPPYDFITGIRESFMGAVTDQVDDHRHTVV